MLGHQSRRSIAWLISLSASRHNQSRASIVKAAVDSMDGLASMPQRIAVCRQAIQTPGLQPRRHHGELSDTRAVDSAYQQFRAWPVQHKAISRQADPSILASYAAQYPCNQGPPCFAPYWKGTRHPTANLVHLLAILIWKRGLILRHCSASSKRTNSYQLGDLFHNRMLASNAFIPDPLEKS